MAEPLRPDIQKAKDRLHIRLGGGREIKKLQEYLWDDEVVDLFCVGWYGRGQGLLVLTNSRLLFIKHGVTGQTTEDFPIQKISSIQWAATMTAGTITIFASGNKAEVKNVDKADGKAFVDRVRGIVSGHTEAVPAASMPANLASPSAQESTATPTPPPPPPGIPAGWYPDQADAVLLRYWDGSQWTEHTAPRPPQ